MTTNVHFKSQTDEWSTPQDLFDRLNAEFGPFDLDPCATANNAKCARFFTREDDGLSLLWNASRIFMNPPYGRAIGKWMKKAWEEHFNSTVVVCLVPARTDTVWFQDFAMRGEIRFIRGRLKFGGSKNSAPFPSAVVIFRSDGRG